MENSEIIRYATENHTDELIRKIIDTYHDHSTNDNIKEKEDKIIAMCTAVAIRSINKTTINYGGTPPDNKKLTAIIIRRIEMTYYNNSLDENKKRKKYRILCLEVIFQNNMGKFVESFRIRRIRMLNKLNRTCPFIYGIFGSLGLLCCTSIFLDLDYKVSAHPYAHPFCVFAGSISLIVCLAVFCLDIVIFMNENKKLRRLFTEFAITIISFFGFIFIWSELWELVSEFIAYKGW